MSPSSSRSEPDPFGFLVARGPVAQATSATAWVQAMLDAEAALAGAQADVGDIPDSAAAAIAAVCVVDRVDVAGLLDEAALGGNPVIPLVPRLRALVGPGVAGYVHRGATSQDIVDAATICVVRRCAELVGGRLEASAEAVARLGEAFGEVPMISRTLGQFAVPTTFATVTERWTDGLTEAAVAVSRHGTPAGRPRRPVGRRLVVRGAGRRHRRPLRRPPARHGGAVRAAHPAQRHGGGGRRMGTWPRRRWPRSPSTSCCSSAATSVS